MLITSASFPSRVILESVWETYAGHDHLCRRYLGVDGQTQRQKPSDGVRLVVRKRHSCKMTPKCEQMASLARDERSSLMALMHGNVSEHGHPRSEKDVATTDAVLKPWKTFTGSRALVSIPGTCAGPLLMCKRRAQTLTCICHSEVIPTALELDQLQNLSNMSKLDRFEAKLKFPELGSRRVKLSWSPRAGPGSRTVCARR